MFSTGITARSTPCSIPPQRAAGAINEISPRSKNPCRGFNLMKKNRSARRDHVPAPDRERQAHGTRRYLF
jgi:hypothetical protein